MQRTFSAMDFSNLLSSHLDLEQQQQPKEQEDTEMATVGVMPLQIGGQSHGDDRQDFSRPFKCSLCDKAFNRLEHKTRHVRTHTGEKPYECQFLGCSRRFSRRDERDRHTIIHNKPNPRRRSNNSPQQAIVQAANNGITSQDFPSMSTMLRLPSTSLSHSAPTSALRSPNASSNLNPYARSITRGPESGPQLVLDINLLVIAAIQVERESISAINHRSGSRHHPYSSLSAYHISGSDSNEEEDYPKLEQSRSNSVQSTAALSTTFSQNSQSNTPSHTPLATPAQSPYLTGVYNNNCGYDLPKIHHLPLQHTPALAAMEPQNLDGLYHAAQPTNTPGSGLSISDIILGGTQRILPVPQVFKVAARDLFSNDSGFNSSLEDRLPRVQWWETL